SLAHGSVGTGICGITSPLTISYNYEIVYHRQKERESPKTAFPCLFDRIYTFLHFVMAYFSTKSELKRLR
ncbi:MAG: hypothetical protein IJ254_04565, partial [Succinivibrio sp.]|nr:hypothetical protein [Succinivibrio sp.]